jgi:hypothetical protein
MNWELIGAVAEVAGALAVVISLIFLRLEIRSSRRSTESASVDALAVGFNSWNAQLTSDPVFFEMFYSILSDPDSARAMDKARFLYMFQSLANHLSTVKNITKRVLSLARNGKYMARGSHSCLIPKVGNGR